MTLQFFSLIFGIDIDKEKAKYREEMHRDGCDMEKIKVKS